MFVVAFAACFFLSHVTSTYRLTFHKLSVCLWATRYGVTKVIDKSKKIADVPQWFEGCRLNYAENLMRYRDDRVALYGLREYVHSRSLY